MRFSYRLQVGSAITEVRTQSDSLNPISSINCAKHVLELGYSNTILNGVKVIIHVLHVKRSGSISSFTDVVMEGERNDERGVKFVQ